MADISGPGGSITLMTGASAHFAGWAANWVLTNVENTGFAEQGNRTFLVTAQNLSGTAIGTGDSSNSMIPTGLMGTNPTFSSAQGTVTLIANSGKTMSFLANLTTISLNRPADGKMDTVHNFISSGPITGNL